MSAIIRHLLGGRLSPFEIQGNKSLHISLSLCSGIITSRSPRIRELSARVETPACGARVYISTPTLIQDGQKGDFTHEILELSTWEYLLILIIIFIAGCIDVGLVRLGFFLIRRHAGLFNVHFVRVIDILAFCPQRRVDTRSRLEESKILFDG